MRLDYAEIIEKNWNRPNPFSVTATGSQLNPRHDLCIGKITWGQKKQRLLTDTGHYRQYSGRTRVQLVAVFVFEYTLLN